MALLCNPCGLIREQSIRNNGFGISVLVGNKPPNNYLISIEIALYITRITKTLGIKEFQILTNDFGNTELFGERWDILEVEQIIKQNRIT